MPKNNNTSKIAPLVTYLAIGGGAYLLYRLFKKPVIEDGTSQDISYNANNLTYPDATYTVLADAIYQAFNIAGFSSFYEDDEAIGNALMQMQSNDDVAKLIRTYGTRAGTLLTTDKNLVEAVQAYLDNDVKETVNANYQSKGINFYWP